MPAKISKEGKAEAVGGAALWTRWVVLGAACALVVGVYAWAAQSGPLEVSESGARDNYYNLLVRGFQAGHLNLDREAPLSLTQPGGATNGSWQESINARVADLSYYHGKLYLYFGVTPALILFWPCAAVSGHYLTQQAAAGIFLSVGFLAAAGLLCMVWRSCFREAGVGTVAAGVLALGLANFAPVILGRCQVYEVPISCGYALTMLALAAVWKALHKGRWQWEWLAAASLAYGLALGARPSLFFGAVILLVPLAQEWREKRRMGSLLAAAAVPIALVGLGLMLYNALRFGDPLEFGQKYQLPLPPQRQFSPQYIGFNLIVGFLAPARWGGQLPIVQDARGLADIALPALPPRYHNVDYPFGILTNIPLVWLALAGPLAWRRRGDGADRPVLRWFLGAVAFLFAMIALPLLTHDSMSVRYEMEYTAPLVLLAAVGALALERALAGRTLWRRVARCGWGLLLISSIVFNLFAAFQLRADSHADIAFNLLQAGRPDQAVVEYEKALRLKPNYAEAHNNLGDALTRLGRANEAVAHFQRALQLKPDYSEACYNYGTTLLQMGKLDEAIAQLEKSAQIKPDFAEARNNLGNALLLKGSLNEAVSQLREALRINPNHTTAHFNLGNALAQMGRLDEAITHFQQALQFNPDYAEAHCNLGTTLLQKGRVDEAIPHFRKALEIRPAYADACANLGVALARKGQTKEAIASWQRSLEINPDQVNVELNLAWLLATSPEASLRNGARAVALATQADQSGGGGNPMILRALAAAYAEARSYELAASTARRALDLAVTQKNDALAASLREDVKLYETGAPLRETPP